MKTMMASLAAVLMLAVFLTADDKTATKVSPAATFEKLKSLKGDWDIKHAPGNHGHEGVVSYKVTAAGSAVMETIFGGTDHEMITMFYMEGDNLALTHYCMLQNRPHMRAEKLLTPDKVVFKCKDGEDPKLDAEDHMHQATFTFVDADHVKTDWVMYKGGKADGEHSFELVRQKK